MAKHATIRCNGQPMHTSANSDWRPLYEAAMRETDLTKKAQRIAVARVAILDQIEQSIRNPVAGEQCAMDAALRNLRKLAGA